jgi:hypothetical protein
MENSWKTKDEKQIAVTEKIMGFRQEDGWFTRLIASYEKRVFIKNTALTKESCEKASKAWQRRMAGLPEEGVYANFYETKNVVVCQSIKMPFLLWAIYFLRDMVAKGEQRQVAGVKGNIYVFYVKYLLTFAKDMVVFKINKYKARRLQKEREKEEAQRFEEAQLTKAIQIELLKKMNERRN